MRITGSASEVEGAIRKLLVGLLPAGSNLEFSEHESWRAEGALMNDHNVYFGVLTVTLCETGHSRRELAKINSRNTSLTSSGQYLCDRNNYDYVISEEKVLSWFPR